MLVGLTGGIGSGKSTVALILTAFGIPVFDADSEAKKLYKLKEVQEQVKNHFGEDIFSQGELNKERLARIVFNDPEKLRHLESILYPALENEFVFWQEKYKNTPYQVKEAAVMLEKGNYTKMDKVILVTADRELRVSRVMNRNQISKEEVEARMNEQWSDDKKRKFADFEIVNNEKTSLVKKVWAVHQQILSEL